MTKNLRRHTLYRYLSITAVIAACFMIGFLSTGSEHPASPDDLPALQGEKAVTFLKQKGLYSSLSEAMQAARYKVYETSESQQADEPFYADNPAQGYSTKFSPDGVNLVLSSEEGKGPEMSMRLQSYGYGNRQIAVLPGRLTSEGNRVEIARAVVSGQWSVASNNRPPTTDHRPPITEWYVNRPEGLEQGFTISERPGGSQPEERLRIAMEVRGALQPEASDDGRCVVMRDETGKVVLRYSGLKVWDAEERELRAEIVVRGRRVSIEVEEEGAIYPLTIDPVMVTEVAKILASDHQVADFFGLSVSISGDTAIVGAYGEDTSGSQAGAAYIFERNQGGFNNWGQVKKILASDGQADDNFGRTVSISGDTAIVGAPFEDAGGVDAGAVYIFERNQGGVNNWGQVKKLLSSDIEADDRFGTSLSIDGDTAIVSAPFEDAGGDLAGAAYVFERNLGGPNNWGEVKKLIASDSDSLDTFGSVSISGDTIVVGVASEDTAGNFAGAAYIFERNAGGANNWGQVKKFVSSDIEAGDFFGGPVAISGDTIIVAASGEDTAGMDAGAVYIFERNAGGVNNWGQVKKLLASDAEADDRFGNVSISGDTLIVGTQEEDTGGSRAGAAYIFERNQGGVNNWGEVAKILASDADTEDRFGNWVSISGGTAIVGAWLEGGAGAAYIFTTNGPPMILTQPVSVERDTTNAGATIATVSDDLTPASSLTVTAGSPPAGITLSNITNTGGTITADVSAACLAAFGANTITLSVMDGGNLVTMATLTVTVIAEMTPPVVTCPADIMVGNDKGQCSATVNFTATANDNCDPGVTPVCTPPSGATFPVGATTVSCTATDAAGNTGQCSFMLTVADTEVPGITCPLPVTVPNDSGQCSAVVNFTATASDNCDGAITPVCVPPSGASFPVGTTTVNCTATDGAGNFSNCSFTVTVNDTENPAITCPDNIIAVGGVGQPTVIVNYIVPSVGAGTASDNCAIANVVCNPPSGSAFPLGTTTVTCTATDTSANIAQCSFTVSAFDVCIEDDSEPGNEMLLITTGPLAGTYVICCGGQTLTGTGTMSNKNGVIGMTHFTTTRRVQAFLYMNQQKGTASLQSPPSAFPCVISDSDITNNNCSCSP